MPKYFTLVFSFAVKGTIIYYVAISNNNSDLFTCEDNMLFLPVKIMFLGKSSPDISLVFI